MTIARLSRKALALLSLGVAAAILAACGGSGKEDLEKLSQSQNDEGGRAKGQELLYPQLASRNTTRIPGKDPTQDAAFSALIGFPSDKKKERPRAIVLVDKDNWQGVIAASSLVHAPHASPVLLTDGDDVPEITTATIDALSPTGLGDLAGKSSRGVTLVGVQVKPTIEGHKMLTIDATGPAGLAAKVDSLKSMAEKRPGSAVVVVSSDSPSYAMPVAAWAAKSGDSVLFVTRDAVPQPTKDALARHKRPDIYLLGPDDVISKKVEKALRKFGNVSRIAAKTPVESAIKFARFQGFDFGWGIVDPGHSLTFANLDRPLDAAAAAPLAASGKFGPLLLIGDAGKLPRPLSEYLLDIQPGYDIDPVRGIYNHGWIIGDTSAISVSLQREIDGLLEIKEIEVPDQEFTQTSTIPASTTQQAVPQTTTTQPTATTTTTTTTGKGGKRKGGNRRR